ncbi:MAG: MBL fold metallo-hydrolase [Chloroflexota bacterium]
MSTKVVLLGTGSPSCQPHSFQSSSAVVVGERPFIIDCGGGTVQRISQAIANGQSQLQFNNIGDLILTHLHPDHTSGLADFIITTWVLRRFKTLNIYGPKGTAKMVNLLVEAYELGIAEHQRAEFPNADTLRLQVIEYTSGPLIQDEHVTVTAFDVSHGGLESYGLKFETADKTVVFSGDTKPHPNIIQHAQNCDLLIHECYSEVGLHQSHFSVSYFRRMHTSTQELAEIANQSKPKKLIITHKMHLSDISDASFVDEIKQKYDGVVLMGQDLEVFQ